LKKPNILFLFSDQHNAKCLSCEQHTDVKTPNLDQLAAKGVRFTNAYTNNPICTPSRMSFLSGLYPSTHGYYGLYGHEPNEPITNMFKYFKDNGYRTGALGKLHTPRYWIERDCQFVYDEFIEHPKYLEGAGLYEDNDNRAFNGNKDGEISRIPLEHSCEVALAKQAIRFIRNEGEPKDRGEDNAPWFAWVSFSRPHQPYTASEPYASMYPKESITLPPTSETETEETKQRRREIPEDELRKYVSAYLGLVSQVDYGIGMVIDELKKRGELDNTIIVYSADHGDYAGEHGMFEKKGGISYRAITQIPMIVSLPHSNHSGAVCDTLVEAVDLFPTICECAEINIPNTVQGISFKALLNGESKEIRENALTENPYRKAIATKEWRYVANLLGEQADELYHITEDPYELNNRINDPNCAEIASKMQRTLFDRVVKARKPINTINGGWYDHKYDADGRINLNTCGDTNPYW
jgi:choline-sulfatase/uncharacterized sulfatase